MTPQSLIIWVAMIAHSPSDHHVEMATPLARYPTRALCAEAVVDVHYPNLGADITSYVFCRAFTATDLNT